MNNKTEQFPYKILDDGFIIKVIFLGFLVRIISAYLIPPGFDEAYYGVYSFFLSSGYFDHPPLVAFIAGIGQWITFTSNYLTLRLGAILLYVPSVIVASKIAYNLHGRTAARYTAVLMHIVPYFLVGIGAFVIPDNSLTFFWLLTLYSLILIKKGNQLKHYLLLGTALGFAMLSKYHSVFLFGSIGFIVIFYKEWRFLLKTPHFYLALFLAIIIFAPNIVWNYNHNWISYIYQFGKSGDGGTNISLNSFLQGVFVQAGYLLPWNMAVFIYALIKLIKQNSEMDRFLFPFIFFPIVAFTAIGATRQILPHWPMPGYISAVASAGYLLSKMGKKYKAWILTPSFVIVIIALVIINFQAVTGLLPLNKKADITLDGQGWDEVITFLEENDYLNSNSFMFTNKWFLSGELFYAGKNKYKVANFNEEHPHGFPFWIDYEKLKGMDGYFISTDRFPEDAAKLYNLNFDNITFITELKTYKYGNEAQFFKIWKCEGYRGNLRLPY